jgi:hypothetical protein
VAPCQATLVDVEDVVAVRIELAGGGKRYILTWGRIYENVDPRPLEAVVLRECRRFALNDEPIAAAICRSLREPAESDQAPYFFEHLLWFGWHPIPFGPDYDSWRAEREAALDQGREMLYCGNP